jgi:hypothetical protein
MDDRKQQSGSSTATLDPQDQSKFSAAGIINNADFGSNVFIKDEHGDPVDILRVDKDGKYVANLKKGTYKVIARKASGEHIEEKILSFGKNGFAPLSFGAADTHKKDDHLPHPYHEIELPEKLSQDIIQTLDTKSLPNLNVDITTDAIKKDAQYSKIQEKVLSDRQISWLKQNPGKTWEDFRKDSSEQQYLTTAYTQDVDKRFYAEHPDVVERIKQEQSSKIHPNSNNDTAYKQYEAQSTQAANEAAKKAEEEWKKNGKKGEFDRQKIYDQQKLLYAKAFTDQFGTKAKAYAKSDDFLQQVQEYYTFKKDIQNTNQFIAESLVLPSTAKLDIKTSTNDMQQDSRYKALVEELLKEQPLNAPSDDQTFQAKVEKRFREKYPNLGTFYDDRAKNTPKIKSDQAIYEQYEKQSNVAADNAVKRVYEEWQKGDQKTKFDKKKIYDAEKYRMAAQFALMYKDKAAILSTKDSYLQRVTEYYKTLEKQTSPLASSPNTVDAKSLSAMGFDVAKLEALRSQNSGQTPEADVPTQGFTQEDAQDTANAVAKQVRIQMALSAEIAREQEALSNQQQKEDVMVDWYKKELEKEEQIREEERRLRQNSQQPAASRGRNPRTQRNRLLDRGSNGIQNARRVKQVADNLVKGVTQLTRVARFIPGPWLVGIIIAILLLVMGILVVLQVLGFLKSVEEKPIQQIQGLSLRIEGKKVATIGETLKYDIKITYRENAPIPYENITVQYKIPEGAEYQSLTGAGDVNNETKVVSWKLARPENRAGFSVIIIPRVDNIVLQNQVIASSTTGGLPYNPGTGIEDTSSVSLDEAFKLSSQRNNIPVAFLKAIAKKESGVLGYNQAEYEKFNTTDWFVGKLDNAPIRGNNHPDIIRGYGYNTCLYLQCYAGADVRGAMQFDLPAWINVRDEVTPLVGHTAERRYVRDVVLGSGVYVRKKTEIYAGRFGPFNNNDWTERQVKAMAASYCGGNPDQDVKFDRACGVTRNGVRYGYDEIVWEYYKEFKAIGN